MKRVSQKMITSNHYRSISKLILITFLTLATFSCSNDDDQPSTTEGISQEIKDLVYFKGNENAPTVLINVQAGPSTQLAEDDVNFIVANFNTTDILTVNPHQSQTLDPTIINGNEKTLEQAVNYNAQSVETLYKVIRYFKDQGRTVYVVGISFGAFITQELIAEKGIDVADEYLIISGRLDINDVVWQALAEGQNAYFENGVTPIIDEDQFAEVFERNEARLFAGIAMNRYTQHFSTFESLANITYIYGATDEAVGGLTDDEIAFLQSKNANILSGDGGHDEPFKGFIEQGFSQAFGIE